MIKMRILMLDLLILLCFASKAQAFSCYVCDSKDDNECVENLPRNSLLEPQTCRNITDAKYCIKTTNLYAGELGTKRFCSAKDQGNYCTYVKQATGDREYRSCVLTCSSENCNTANSWTRAPLYVGFFSILLSYVLTTNS